MATRTINNGEDEDLRNRGGQNTGGAPAPTPPGPPPWAQKAPGMDNPPWAQGGSGYPGANQPRTGDAPGPKPAATSVTTDNPGVWTLDKIEEQANINAHDGNPNTGYQSQGGNIEVGYGRRKVDLPQIRVPTTQLRGDLGYNGTTQGQFNKSANWAEGRGGPNTRLDFANSIAAANKGMAIGDQFAAVANDPSKSAALQMFNQGLDRSMSSQMAAANAGRGGLQRAAAMRNAQNAGAQMKMQGNQQAAQMMAQERMANLGAAANAYNQGASLFSNQAVAQGQISSDEAMKQRNLNDTFAINAMNMGQKAADADYGARWNKSSTNAQLEHGANVANAEIENKTKLTEEGMAKPSDRRVKENVEDGKLDARQFLDSLKAFSFSYKNPEALGEKPGRQLGVMAQDMERSPAGQLAVEEDGHGIKYINEKEAFAASLAGLADLNDRLKSIEHALAVKHGGSK